MEVTPPDGAYVSLPVPPITLRPKRRAHSVVIAEQALRITRLIIPNDAAVDILIHDIRIGAASEFVSPGAVPAVAFSELAVGVAIGFDVARASAIVDIVFENTTDEPRVFAYAFMGTAPNGTKFSSVPPTDGRRYHTWVLRRQKIYESLHRGEGEDSDCYFNGQEIFPDTFTPKTNLWWVDVDGYPKRPVYTFESVSLGERRGGWQVVNIETYEGFDL